MNVHRLVYLLTLVILLSSFCVAEDEAEELDEDELAVQRWREMFKNVKKFVDAGMKAAMPHIMSSITDGNLTISKECSRAMFQWIADIKHMKPWALKMGDASAKVIDGLLTGSLAAFGSYDQCLDTVNPKGTIQGKYCNVQMWPRLPPKPRFYAINQRLKAFKRFENDTGVLGEFTKSIQYFYMFPIRLGICIPHACSETDLENIAAQVSKFFFHLNVTVPHCEVLESTVVESNQIPILCAIAIMTLFVIVGTSYDYYAYRKHKTQPPKDMGIMSECIIAFSAIENWNKLVDLDAGADDLRALHGIRFTSMCWIILGHTYYHLNFNILRHLEVTIALTSEFIFSIITNATFLVDNFFFLGGLLLIYVTMDMVKVIGKIPRGIYFIIHRFWRFLPIMAFFVCSSFLLPLLGSGPTWHENIDPLVDGCKKSWWVNMIFINNLYRNSEKVCLSYSWYLAADFQIYIFCIPIVMLIIRKPRIGLWVNFAVVVLASIAIGVHNYIRDLPPTLLFTLADLEQRNALLVETYYTPLHHVGPFCIGIFAGYFLQIYKKPINMHWSLHTIAWIASFISTSAALFGVYPWNKGYHGATGPLASAFYAALSRVSWTIGTAWITVACSKGCGGLLGKFLRAKLFIPFSRLTFLVYMAHPLVQIVFYAALRDGIQAMNHLAVYICIGFIASSYGIALLLCILLESPCINLGKMIFRRREAAKKKNRPPPTSNGKTNGLPDTTPPSWKSGPIAPLANGNGTCNGAYDFRSDTTEDVCRERTGSTGGDFICHL